MRVPRSVRVARVSRRGAAALACVGLALSLASPAGAEGLNNLKAGANALITFPADPVMSAVNPPEDFKDLPGEVVVAPVGGFLAGCVLGVYRGFMGAMDVILTPFWVFPTLSPEPRYSLIPAEYE